MLRYIIDTNVLVVANENHSAAKEEDVFQCQQLLFTVMKNHISIDSLELIFNEYLRHAKRSGQPGVGDAFVKWLWSNQFGQKHCERVDITPISDGEREFSEFPDNESLKGFDRDDQKFVAVAIAGSHNPVICNATDSDWWHYKDAFQAIGIKIDFICPDLIKKSD